MRRLPDVPSCKTAQNGKFSPIMRHVPRCCSSTSTTRTEYFKGPRRPYNVTLIPVGVCVCVFFFCEHYLHTSGSITAAGGDGSTGRMVSIDYL